LVPRGTVPLRRETDVMRHALVVANIPTPLGVALRVTATDEALVRAEFVGGAKMAPRIRHRLLAEAAAQVRAHFARRLRRFDVPLRLEGTPFQRSVWRTVADLEFGDVVSYADVARAVGQPLAHRGVAMAMRATPIDLFIAAHRVVGADGRVRGCGPRSLRARLLAFERLPARRLRSKG
jgi:O-6-methylguanine DNA methyltransferase